MLEIVKKKNINYYWQSILEILKTKHFLQIKHLFFYHRTTENNVIFVERFIQKNFNRRDKERQEINRKHVSVFQKRVQTQREKKYQKIRTVIDSPGLRKNECLLSKILRELLDAFFVKRRVVFFS